MNTSGKASRDQAVVLSPPLTFNHSNTNFARSIEILLDSAQSLMNSGCLRRPEPKKKNFDRSQYLAA